MVRQTLCIWMIFIHEETIQMHRPRLAGYIPMKLLNLKSLLTLSSATSSCERERTSVSLLLKNVRRCFDRGCEMAVVAFTSLCSTYSLCSFSPIVSIFLMIVLTTVSSSIPLEYNGCRSVLSFRARGFSYLQVMSLEL